jgi:hypothetical protein
VVRSSTYSVASDDNSSSGKTVSYIVVNGGGSSTVTAASGGTANVVSTTNATTSDSGSVRVDWSGSTQKATTTGLTGANDWVSDFLGTAPDQRSLAEKTGLVVKVKG